MKRVFRHLPSLLRWRGASVSVMRRLKYRRRYPVVGVAALSCFALAWEARPATAAFPGRNGQIAFAAGGIPRIFALDPEGGDRRPLTPAGLFAFGPAYSADGRRIVFTAITKPYDQPDGFRIYVMNADGSRLRRVSREEDATHGAPAFSPDGRMIAFTRNAEARSDLYIMNADGTKPRLLATAAESPTFSPSGRTIVFAASYKRAPGLYAIRPDGTGERQLTVDTRRHVSPDFSPDGRRIAFVRVTGQAGFCCSGSVNVVDAHGRHRRRLTGRSLDGSPAFSPDGRRIVFERFGPPFYDHVLWIMTRDGRSRRTLERGHRPASGATWQPVRRR